MVAADCHYQSSSQQKQLWGRSLLDHTGVSSVGCELPLCSTWKMYIVHIEAHFQIFNAFNLEDAHFEAQFQPSMCWTLKMHTHFEAHFQTSLEPSAGPHWCELPLCSLSTAQPRRCTFAHSEVTLCEMPLCRTSMHCNETQKTINHF